MTIYTPTTIITVCTVGSAIGLLLTTIRFYVRLRYAPTRLGPDDFFIILATIFTLLFYSLYMYDTVKGAAGNATTAADHVAVVEHMMDYAMMTSEKFAYGAVKLSLLFFFRRIFGLWPTFRTINNAMIVVVALWSLGFFFAGAFICGAHPERYWAVDQRIPAATCGDGGACVFCPIYHTYTDAQLLLGALLIVSTPQCSRSVRRHERSNRFHDPIRASHLRQPDPDGLPIEEGGQFRLSTRLHVRRLAIPPKCPQKKSKSPCTYARHQLTLRETPDLPPPASSASSCSAWLFPWAGSRGLLPRCRARTHLACWR